MNRIFILLLFLGAFVLSQFVWDTVTLDKISSKMPKPTFNLLLDKGPELAELNRVDIDGQTIKIKNPDNKVTIISFWASWCAPCMAELPTFISLQDQYKDQGLQIIGISLDYHQDDAISVRNRYHIPYPIVMMDSELSEAFGGISSIPATFFIDHNQQVVGKLMGYERQPFFDNLIQTLLEKANPTKESL